MRPHHIHLPDPARKLPPKWKAPAGMPHFQQCAICGEFVFRQRDAQGLRWWIDAHPLPLGRLKKCRRGWHLWERHHRTGWRKLSTPTPHGYPLHHIHTHQNREEITCP